MRKDMSNSMGMVQCTLCIISTTYIITYTASRVTRAVATRRVTDASNCDRPPGLLRMLLCVME